MSLDNYIQFQDTVHHEVSVKELAEQMSPGQMQHMANHMYKHYDVAPQKLRKHLEDATRENVILSDAVQYWKDEAEEGPSLEDSVLKVGTKTYILVEAVV